MAYLLRHQFCYAELEHDRCAGRVGLLVGSSNPGRGPS